MINDLFQDMINQRNIVTFIDDIIVAIDTEEEHNKLVEGVLKKGFVPRKGKVYLLSREKREDVQVFVEDQL